MSEINEKTERKTSKTYTLSGINDKSYANCTATIYTYGVLVIIESNENNFVRKVYQIKISNISHYEIEPNRNSPDKIILFMNSGRYYELYIDNSMRFTTDILVLMLENSNLALEETYNE